MDDVVIACYRDIFPPLLHNFQDPDPWETTAPVTR